MYRKKDRHHPPIACYYKLYGINVSYLGRTIVRSHFLRKKQEKNTHFFKRIQYTSLFVFKHVFFFFAFFSAYYTAVVSFFFSLLSFFTIKPLFFAPKAMHRKTSTAALLT